MMVYMPQLIYVPIEYTFIKNIPKDGIYYSYDLCISKQGDLFYKFYNDTIFEGCKSYFMKVIYNSKDNEILNKRFVDIKIWKEYTQECVL